MYKALKAVNRALRPAVEYMSAILMGTMALLVIYQVFNRSFIHAQTVWTEEMARFSMIWVTMLGSSIAVRTDEHISVKMIFQLWPGRTTDVIRILGCIFTELFYVILFVSSFLWVKGTTSILTQASRISVTWIYCIFPICSAVMILFQLEIIVDHILALVKKGKAPDPAGEVAK